MKRRDLVRGAGIAAVAAGLTACGAKQGAEQKKKQQVIPKNCPCLRCQNTALAKLK